MDTKNRLMSTIELQRYIYEGINKAIFIISLLLSMNFCVFNEINYTE